MALVLHKVSYRVERPAHLTSEIVSAVEAAFEDINNHRYTLDLLKDRCEWLAGYTATAFVALRDNSDWQLASLSERTRNLKEEICKEKAGDYDDAQPGSDTEV